ncbi:hypothetical protein OKA05_12855 [Luteolibacter arcticus]|uniref:Cellobiose phosphorylase n=1 Tax=Luteolibacter arcticus TaxID=1581411 RepID=A0ABT3GIY4_9BACT|nr:hypothetical protein [Luteolibacter arcticus]MCW1923446.1 hypothetical protein [Luteolibacter arcticus]
MSAPPTAPQLPPAIGIGPFPPANRWTSEAGQDYALIEGLEDMAPFFLNIVSSDDHWLFCASNGALSAGRGTADCALFPYETVDKIIEGWNTTGPWTAIMAGDVLWEPMRPATLPSPAVKRRLRKNMTGDEVVFEEEHEGLGLRFSYRWQCSARFGFVRRARLENLGKRPVRLRLVDGLDSLLPPGVDKRMQSQLSCLADAYKLSELQAGGRLLIHRLAAGIIDRAIPLESLHATTVWAHGLDGARTCLTRGEAEEFLRGTAPRPASVVRGQRGAMFLARSFQLEAEDSVDWMMVAEVRQSQAEVSELARQMDDLETLAAEVDADVLDGRARLQRRVASADGIQHGADRDATLHHYHNTLCNILRGGVPVEGSKIRPQQFAAYLTKHNTPLRERYRSWLSHLPPVLPREAWLEEVRALGEPDLERLAVEYLPLVLSRRHGDPSRPWNRFDIRVRDENGERIQHFEGNWRDIFQNWEALAWSHPGYLDAFITKFLNASTIDGYNPYRISSDGLDWEVPDPEDPWATIGYWGDHQIVYLLKFLELQAAVRPDFLAGQLDRAAYVFADVPYRLCGWEETLADPRHTVRFDQTRHAVLMERKAEIGSDGLLLRDQQGNLCRVTLAEKLLLPAMVKLANLVPGGGIWMNTQRPEWNDANNALAGCGLSVVTAAYLFRYLAFVEALVASHRSETLSLSAHLTDLIAALDEVLADPRWQSNDPGARFELVASAGRAAERHREQVYRDGPGETVELDREELLDFLRRAGSAVRRTLQQNRRPDGLYHSYNVLESDDSGRRMELARLSEMLEGQVAILTSGLLDAGEAAALLEALPQSQLYSTRHDSYLLYPDRELPGFLDFNRVDEGQVFGIAALSEMLAAKDHRILVPDSAGGFRFHPSLVNDYELAAALERAGVTGKDRSAIHALYEAVFNHLAFTGRSATMFAYEGLGCIYWHMVSKLMLAAQEFALKSDGDLRRRLTVSYYGIQRGLGFRKSPQDYGAFPAEAYSHSPGYAGAQQPGLTGQVKEGILCRFGELGVSFDRGAIRFRPRLLRAAEFATDPRGESTLSFTLAGTPVVYQCRDSLNDATLTVRSSDGRCDTIPGSILPVEHAAEIIRRSGRITGIAVDVPTTWLLH